jgi:hypothetical protein
MLDKDVSGWGLGFNGRDEEELGAELEEWLKLLEAQKRRGQPQSE